jgi:SAM-dependent methyltransferase
MESIGRNAPCPCGSGRRYKHCCGGPDAFAPRDAQAYHALGKAQEARGQTDAALASFRRALALEEAPEFKASFAQLVQNLEFRRIDPDVRGLVARALSEPWARPADLATTVVRLVKLRQELRECIERAAQAWPDRLTGRELFGPSGPAAISADPLLCSLLESAPIPDIPLERFLTLARYALLDRALRTDRGDGKPDAPLAFDCALASQCLLNDYVYSCSDEESRRADALRDRLAAALQAGDTVPASWVVAVAAYYPLLSLPSAESLLDRQLPAPVRALLLQHVAEPLQERALRATVPALTGIDDALSLAVRRQYEENPYPRWIKSPPPAQALPLAAWLRQSFPGMPQRSVGRGGGTDLLVAGCGTGRETLELARQIALARVLAVDLSLSSLGYARRKSLELGVENVEFAQADINRLHAIGRTFDLVSSVGVLHHLADPEAGLRELLPLVRPGGFMILGLYSEIGRRSVVAARKFIAERGYAATAAGIRQCRQDLVALDDGAEPKQVTAYTDFYVTGECRDLLFHVREHRFTLARIAEMLARLGLTFHGFIVDPRALAKYRERYPDDPEATRLDCWSDFEAAFPYTFAGMYVFLVRKPGPGPQG